MPLYRATPTEFHPEFGYLVPTRKLRNTVRVALAAALFGVVAGAVGVMVLLPRIGRDLRIEQVASSVPATTVGITVVEPTDAVEGNAAPPVAATSRRLPAFQDGVAKGVAPKGIAASGLAPKGSADSGTAPNGTAPNGTAPNGTAPKGNATARNASAAPAAAADADKPCKEETWPYFDSKCLWGGPAKDAAAPAQPTRTGPTVAAVDVATPAVTPTEQRPAVAAATAPKRKVKAAPVRKRHREDPDPRTAARSYYDYGYGSPFARRYSGGWGFGW